MDLSLETPAKTHWKNIGIGPHHGICVPLFSLKSQKSHGIGEYLDLIPLIDWCREVGFDTLQLLPLNDTGGNPSPYDALSVFALNPIHISLDNHPSPKLNALQYIDYEKVWQAKKRLLRGAFLKVRNQLWKSEKFCTFVEENPWLESYGHFRGDVEFYTFLQFVAFQQLQQVKAHAESRGVLLKGDIPILLSKQSVDVKTHPQLFLTHLDAGAPPEPTIPQGQNWHFPLYDWENNFDGCIKWWKKRLQIASRLYHLYRLDHVVGLFRIWAIPENGKATQGWFVPKQQSQWIPLGKKILEEMLKSSSLLPIAEDLGCVPKSVKQCLQEMGVPGTKVIRWTREGDSNGRYLERDEYPRVSMTTLSTHDTQTLAQWWKQRPEEAKPFAKMMGIKWQEKLSQTERLEILKFSHVTKSLFHINLLGEWLALYDDLVWPKLSQERINHPGRQLKTNWRYRFRKSVEEIVQDERLARAIQSLELLA